MGSYPGYKMKKIRYIISLLLIFTAAVSTMQGQIENELHWQNDFLSLNPDSVVVVYQEDNSEEISLAGSELKKDSMLRSQSTLLSVEEVRQLNQMVC